MTSTIHLGQGSYHIDRNENLLDKDTELIKEDVYLLGMGSYGEVYTGSADDEVIKISKRLDGHLESTSLREIAALKSISPDSPYTINLKQVNISSENVILTFPRATTTLHNYLSNNASSLTSADRKRIIWHLSQAIRTLHESYFVHRDLHTENILVFEDRIVVADFGSVRRLKGPEPLLDYQDLSVKVCSLWFRAPEILALDLGIDFFGVQSKGYDYSVDLWSLGCIILLILSGVSSFQGEDEVGQFELFQKGIPAQLKEEFYAAGEEQLLDLAERLLTLNPEERPSIVQIMEDPYFKKLIYQPVPPVKWHYPSRSLLPPKIRRDQICQVWEVANDFNLTSRTILLALPLVDAYWSKSRKINSLNLEIAVLASLYLADRVENNMINFSDLLDYLETDLPDYREDPGHFKPAFFRCVEQMLKADDYDLYGPYRDLTSTDFLEESEDNSLLITAVFNLFFLTDLVYKFPLSSLLQFAVQVINGKKELIPLEVKTSLLLYLTKYTGRLKYGPVKILDSPTRAKLIVSMS